MYYLIPWLYFYSSCKKEKKNNIFVAIIIAFFLWLRPKHAANKHTVLLLICAVKDVLSYFGVFSFCYDSSALGGAAAKHFSVIDRFLQSSSDLSLALLHFEAKSNPVFIPAPLLRLWFVLTLLCTWKIFFFFLSVHLRPKALSVELIKPNLASNSLVELSVISTATPIALGEYIIVLNVNTMLTLKNCVHIIMLT